MDEPSTDTPMRITTPFGFHSTAAEVVSGLDLAGRRVVITGAASGIGVETARAIASVGADVTIAVRDLEAGGAVAAELASSTGNPAVRAQHLDLADRGAIDAFVDAWRGPLHVLVNNAGIMATPETRTSEGWEAQFATNHLGHFALAIGLRSALAAGAPARIVSLSSIGHRRSPVVFDDLHFERRPYDTWAAYGQSKTANVLFAVGVGRAWADDGITANAVHPGGIMTNLQRHMDPAEIRRRGWVDDQGRVNAAFKSTEQGAATSSLLAVSPLVEGISGRYFEDCNEAAPASPDDPRGGVESYALDPESANRLWDVSSRMLAGS